MLQINLWKDIRLLSFCFLSILPPFCQHGFFFSVHSRYHANPMSSRLVWRKVTCFMMTARFVYCLQVSAPHTVRIDFTGVVGSCCTRQSCWPFSYVVLEKFSNWVLPRWISVDHMIFLQVFSCHAFKLLFSFHFSQYFLYICYLGTTYTTAEEIRESVKGKGKVSCSVILFSTFPVFKVDVIRFFRGLVGANQCYWTSKRIGFNTFKPIVCASLVSSNSPQVDSFT